MVYACIGLLSTVNTTYSQSFANDIGNLVDGVTHGCQSHGLASNQVALAVNLLLVCLCSLCEVRIALYPYPSIHSLNRSIVKILIGDLPSYPHSA